MTWLQAILYALLSGITEFLPVSARAHQLLFASITGMDSCTPVLNLFIHLAELTAVIMCCSPFLSRLRRDHHTHRRPGSRRVHMVDYDNRLVKTATIPLLILLALSFSDPKGGNLVTLALTSVIGGAIILIAEHMRHANRDARHMSGLDGIFLGIIGGLSFLPGIPRNGAVISYGMARGADRKHAINWAILLSIPALIMLALGDLIALFTGNAETITFVIVLQYILAAICAFFASHGGVRLLSFLSKHMDFSGFAYYSWGIALLSLFIYLIA